MWTDNGMQKPFAPNTRLWNWEIAKPLYELKLVSGVHLPRLHQITP